MKQIVIVILEQIERLSKPDHNLRTEDVRNNLAVMTSAYLALRTEFYCSDCGGEMLEVEPDKFLCTAYTPKEAFPE